MRNGESRYQTTKIRKIMNESLAADCADYADQNAKTVLWIAFIREIRVIRG